MTITIPTYDLLVILGIDAALLAVAVLIAWDRAKRFPR